jgi:hypothetical protein
MPLLPFFALVGSTLVGLLFLADAILPSRGPLTISREFHGLSATLHGEPTGAIQAETRGVAPKPDMASDAVKLASQGAPEAAVSSAVNVQPVNTPVARAESAPKKRKRVAPPREWRDQYAQAQDFGWNWGSNNRAWQNDARRTDGWRQDSRRQDSWRQDSWRQDSWRHNSWQGDRGWR